MQHPPNRLTARSARAPSTPQSLTPVVMSRYADATGAQRAIAPGIAGARPTAKTGSMIILACVLVGGLLGVGIRARRNAEAAALAYQNGGRTAAVVVASTSPSAPPAAVSAGPTAPEQGEPPRARANAPFEALSSPRSEVVAASAPAATTAQASAAAPAASASASAPGAAQAASTGPAAVRSAGGRRSPATKVAAPVKVKKLRDDGHRAAAARDGPGAVKKAERPSKNRSSDDAESVLKAALGATENTL